MIPKKPALGLDPRVGTGFRKGSCPNIDSERDGDSKKSHRPLALPFPWITRPVAPVASS